MVVSRQEGCLRQLQESDPRETRYQGEVKVLQTLLGRKGCGFEPLAQLLLMAALQFALQQRLRDKYRVLAYEGNCFLSSLNVATTIMQAWPKLGQLPWFDSLFMTKPQLIPIPKLVPGLPEIVAC
jgi:hypothetical protein